MRRACADTSSPATRSPLKRRSKATPGKSSDVVGFTAGLRATRELSSIDLFLRTVGFDCPHPSTRVGTFV